MFGLRQKLSMGLGGLFAIILIIGAQSIMKLSELGQSIDVILRENYRSVIACQDMKESLERIDSGTLFCLLGYDKEGTALTAEHLDKFEKALYIEKNNFTVPGEAEAFAALNNLYGQYKQILQRAGDPAASVEERRAAYFKELLPLFQEVKSAANQILEMNQQNMSDANAAARTLASTARQQMYLLLICGSGVAILFVLLTGRWVLQPIIKLIDSTNEITRGNLDLVVATNSKDEIGQLSRSFNAMAESLRQYRRSSQAKLIRIQNATQRAFTSLPDIIAVLDLEGIVEVATEAAGAAFSLRPNMRLPEAEMPWMADLLQEMMRTGRPVELKGGREIIQHFVQGQERFFRPQAIPILDDQMQPNGAILFLREVTQLMQQDEMKRDLIATVSHQLKTPITSMRMALYLLLDEKLGALNPKQEELLLAARDDSNRLHSIVEDLLDIARIQSGRVQMDCRSVASGLLVMESLEPFFSAANDQGVTLRMDLPGDLPDVWADPTRIHHVFGNLLSNAVKYTPAGGDIKVSAEADGDCVRFSVSDTGLGIAPEHAARVFDQFFRAPGQKGVSGAGLGLAIAKEIVDAHGGHIGVRSQPGHGSVFTFSLKRADRV